MRDTELVQRLQRGDVSALDQLYGLYADRALRTAFVVTGNQTSAEDAVQDAFVEVLRHVRSLREPDHFKAWFYRIVVNKAKRSVRPGSFRVLSLDLSRHDQADVQTVSPDEAATLAEEKTAVLEAIERLPDIHRVPLILRYYTELSDAEIAQALDLPVGTVKSRLHHARKTLQDQLITRMQRRDRSGLTNERGRNHDAT